ncbi:MAG TPA: M15 family metallopeptidase [Candidatus Caenarcaniphilales bacterium]|nr:M15 family metallopeptidase [Candidatus Caenarcaniphilales bacterium]
MPNPLSLRLGLLLALACGFVVPAATASAAEPLPECRYDDVRTRYTTYSAWRITLLDTIYKLPRSYVPPRLASTRDAGLNGGYYVRPLVVDDLRALGRAARNADAPVAVLSAYRSYDRQKQLFNAEVERYGEEQALRQVARAGHSEHQLGTTLDFRSKDSTKLPWNYTDWAKTPAGAWLARNGHRFGFVMSYPKGERSTTCYIYEPWHYRYVGRDMAAKVHASGLTLREYLWRHYESAR